LSRAQSF